MTDAIKEYIDSAEAKIEIGKPQRRFPSDVFKGNVNIVAYGHKDPPSMEIELLHVETGKRMNPAAVSIGRYGRIIVDGKWSKKL